jgi:hypothetical protein
MADRVTRGSQPEPQPSGTSAAVVLNRSWNLHDTILFAGLTKRRIAGSLATSKANIDLLTILAKEITWDRKTRFPGPFDSSGLGH